MGWPLRAGAWVRVPSTPREPKGPSSVDDGMHRDRRTVAWLTLALLGCEAAPRTLEDRLETPIDGFANPALLHGVTGDGRSSFLSASVRGSVTELVRDRKSTRLNSSHYS